MLFRSENTPSFGPNSGALQAVGGIGANHNVSTGGAFMHMPYGQSVTNVVIPYNFGGSYGTVAGYPTTPIVTFSDPQLPGGVTAQGVAVVSSNTVVAVAITNPGTGYTSPPRITFSDPTVNSTSSINTVTAAVGLTPLVGQFVKAFQTASGITNGLIYYYVVTTSAAFTSIPTFTSGSSSSAEIGRAHV